ncbi:MAG: hypothetical protein ACK5DE_10475 [Bacteroidota bacterium]|jgi:hypothetical protein
MAKEKKKITAIYSYQVTMTVHIVADDPMEARKKLDDQGGIVTKREVEVLNSQPLYGEQEKK